jgi:hypothetical protein
LLATVCDLLCQRANIRNPIVFAAGLEALFELDDRARLFERYNIREHAATWRRYHEVLREAHP